MPLLANASAQMQGKALVEVCTAYGVALVAQDGNADEPPADHTASHAQDHCVLTAWTALARAEACAWAPIARASTRAAPLRTHMSSSGPDPCATWVARLKHGPPRFS